MRDQILLSAFILTIVLNGALPVNMFGQVPRTDSMSNFFEVQTALNTYFTEHPGSKDEKHWRRFENFYAGRLYPHGDIATYLQARDKAYKTLQHRIKQQARSAHGIWSFVGPSDNTERNFGRCVRIKFDPSDSDIIYVLTSSAGLWKSDDAGNTWQNLTADLPYLFGIDFAIHPADVNNIYILTANVKQGNYGINNTQGIYVTNNGGATWSLRNPLSGARWAFRMVMHPDNPDLMFAGTRDGIYRTDDAWLSATRITNYFDVFDFEFKPDDPTVMYASSRTGFYGSSASGDAGSWSKVTDPTLSFLDTMVRTEIAVTPDNPNCVYLVASDIDADFVARSLSAGASGSWSIRDSTTDLWWYQPGYNMGVVADPDNYQTIYVMAVALWKSETGGAPGGWTDVGTGIHADHHDLAFNGSQIYDVNDGGVFRSGDGGDSWSNITPGIEVFEAYSIAGTPQDTQLYYTGAQDTGGNRIDSGGKFVGVCPGCTGDVVKCMIDYTNKDKAYMVPWQGGLRFTSDGWGSYTDTGPGGANFEPEFGRGIFLCPYEMDPVDPKFIFTGKDSMWRLDMEAQTAQWLGDPGSGKTQRIAQGTNNRNRMYIIHNDTLYRTNDALTNSMGGASWTPLMNDFSVTARMSDLTVNPDNANELYIVYTGTEAGSKVYYSPDSGASGSWQDYSGSLPNTPVNCIEFHDNGLNNHAIYIGTDLGVFYLDDDLSDWVYYGNNLPAVPVTDIYINNTSNKLLVGTAGRGIWQSDVFSECPGSITLLADGEETGGERHYAASVHVTSSKIYDEAFSTKIVYQGGGYVDLLSGFRVVSPGFFHAQTGDCPVIYLAD
jgi:photosystem II stability/assembly factor-like uncharacterized protein